jgi:putative DNA primase/helicase
MTRWLYWKPEPKERKWKLIADTEEARRIALTQGAMFFTWATLSEQFKGNGQPEPCRWGDFPLDFDCKEDPKKALRELRELCLVHLPDLYGVDPRSLRYYASGGKGFHVEIPAKLLDAEEGDPQLPLIYKRIASLWKEQFKLETLDLAIYSMGHGRMWRAPNVRRANGKHKVLLSFEEIAGWERIQN